MKYQVLTLKKQEIPQGWSIDILHWERHYRIGDCIVTYYSRHADKHIRYRLGHGKNVICFKNDKGDINESWGLTLAEFRELFLMEKMKANSKLGQLL